MLTEKEKVLAYWEGAREKRKVVSGKNEEGLPMAMLFGLPILASVVVVYFVPEWYTKYPGR